ncbi:hypothetical protein INP83_19330 [Mucilaginibacter sp. 21P]|uniref:hypothetical protein n=1 Tax=Mucilaginibacter sp. 21P TaxID=2778902 RepID=UPI001C55A5C0|nr:hypothetical protein [Mucilaginibacter sp. 21P]QXV65206.1 hypothetical protein INP83_19330 [Mucilaginibacter sp. 21P]
MSITLQLNNEEVEILLSKYLKDLVEIDAQLNELEKRKSIVKERIESFSANKNVTMPTLSRPSSFSSVKIPKFKELGYDFRYNTLKKKLKRVFEEVDKEMSTGEALKHYLVMFPSEKSKNINTLTQSISKELNNGARDKVDYYKSEINKDENGKTRFGLLLN